MEMDKEKLSISQKISILNERQIAFADQQKRFFAHIESEQRHFQTQGELIKSIEHNMELQGKLLEKDIIANQETLKELKLLIAKHETILVNGRNGLVVSVDRIKQYIQSNKDGRAMIIASIGVLISVLGFILDYLQK